MKPKRTLEEKEKAAVERIDRLLTALAQERQLPKPHYQVYALRRLKKLDPFKPGRPGGLTLTTTINPVRCGAWFYAQGHPGKGLSYHCITVFVRDGRATSNIAVVEEFYHHLDWFTEPGKWKHPNEPGYAEWHASEERRAKSQTRRWWRKHRKKWSPRKYGYRTVPVKD